MTGWGEYFGNDGTDSIIFSDGNYDDDDDDNNNYNHDGDHYDNDDDDDCNNDYSDDHYENDDVGDNHNYDNDHEDHYDDVSRPRRLQRRHGGGGDPRGFDPRSSLHHTIEARLLALC